MKELIINNMEFIIMLVTIGLTWLLGKLSKKNEKLSNKIIPYQNIIIMIVATLIYYWATGNWSMVIASGSPIATLLYDMIHTTKKDNFEEYEDAGDEIDE